jgi:hypothetical protein
MCGVPFDLKSTQKEVITKKYLKKKFNFKQKFLYILNLLKKISKYLSFSNY